MTKRIRLIEVTYFERAPFVYSVGQERKLPINGNEKDREVRTITNIMTETVGGQPCYVIYIANGPSVQIWKEIPVSDRVSVEYFI